jgi:5-methylcytosine-specific restriction protein B
VAEVQVGTFGRAAAVAVEAVGRRLIDAGLGADDSLLTPGNPIWTLEHLDELQHGYVDKPDAGSEGFFAKLRRQLDGMSPEVVQLFAEVLILNVLPIINVGGELKVKQVRSVLDLSSTPTDLPAAIEAALLGGGVFHGGQAFTTYRWAQIAYLIEFARHFKRLPEQRRIDALLEPMSFRDEVGAVSTGQVAQRQSLLYVAFPRFFLPVVKAEHRAAMRNGLAGRYLTEPSGDEDGDLSRIYAAIVEAEGRDVDLYTEPWNNLWQNPSPPKPLGEVRHAWKVNCVNADGLDLMPSWQAEHALSIPATLLRLVEEDVTRDQLTAIVDEDYRSSGYAARQEKVEAFYSFLTRMHADDLVVAICSGAVHFGIVTGPAEFLDGGDDRQLRRTVRWLPTTCLWSDIPDEIAARLTTGGDVVDLSQYLDVLLALAERRPPRRDNAALHLPDPTQQLADRLHVERDWLQDCVDLLRDRRQLIFYGPPGTGKTYLAQGIAAHITDQANVTLVQFHPAYSYEDFFEGFRPQTSETGGQMTGFMLKAGPLRRMVDKAVENPNTACLLIIDEINRGNLPKIFGELYFLLEYRDHAIDLMYSSDSAEAFSLPKNIFVIGTMNTADRSIALVDAALRRRFAFLPLHPSEEPTRSVLRRWLTANGYDTTLADLHDELNRQINDGEFKIGPSYFMRQRIAADPTGSALDLMWRTDILPLLQEHHFGEVVDVAGRYGLQVLRKSLAAKERSSIEGSFQHAADQTDADDRDPGSH